MKRVKSRRGAVAADLGPAERAQHGALVPHATETAGIVGRRVRHECRLDWYQDKASLDDRQHEAGLRFRRDWLVANAPPKLTGTYGPRLGATGQDFHEMQLAARRRVGSALLALGDERGAVVIAVCGFDEWASGRLPRLREALTLLADHYGIARAAAE
jgi:hypothetical protein